MVPDPGAEGALKAGFGVGGQAEKTLLVRGVGPRLADLGVGGVLGDPVLNVYDAQGRLRATNDDWARNADPRPATLAAQRSGAFTLVPTQRDAALVVTLPPGRIRRR